MIHQLHRVQDFVKPRRSASPGWTLAVVLALWVSFTSPVGALPAFSDELHSGWPTPVNINRASAEELQRLPGVGPAKAEAILSARAQRGGFESLEELRDIKGIGPAMLERLRVHLVLSGEPSGISREAQSSE